MKSFFQHADNIALPLVSDMLGVLSVQRQG